MRLPQLPNDIDHYTHDVMQFGGLNVTATAQDGEFIDCSGVSTRDYPYLRQETKHYEIGATAEEAAEFGHYDDPSWAAWYSGDLYVIDDGVLKKNGTTIGSVGTDDELTVAIVGTKMVFWKLGKILDLTNDTIIDVRKKDFSAASGYTINGDTITYPAGTSTVFDSFAANDVVDVYGKDTNNKVAEGKKLTIESVESGKIHFPAGSITHRDPETGESYSTLSVKSTIPDLDFICSSRNRLWGCSTSEQTVFVSALGDPQTFYDYTPLSGDAGSYSFAVSSDGPFTGICAYGGYVCVWKEDIMYKVMGSFPSEYYTVENTFPGVAVGSHNSLANISETLYYLGKNGRVYSFSGNRPNAISLKLGDGYSDGKGFSDGINYWIAMHGNDDATEYLYTFDIARQLWVRHDIDGSILWADERLYIHQKENDDETTTTKLIQIPSPTDARAGIVDPEAEWFAEFSEVTENVFERKGPLKLLVRLDMGFLSSLKIYAREDRRAYRKIWEKQRTTKRYFMDPQEIDFSNVGTPAVHLLPFVSNGEVYAVFDGEMVKCQYAKNIAGTYTFRADYEDIDRRLTLKLDSDEPDDPFFILALTELSTNENIVTGIHTVSFWKPEDYNPVTMLVPIRLGRCDRWQLKFEGVGEVTIRGIAREHVMGSVK